MGKEKLEDCEERKRGLRELCPFMKLGGERLRETKTIFKQQAGPRAEGRFNFKRVLVIWFDDEKEK